MSLVSYKEFDSVPLSTDLQQTALLKVGENIANAVESMKTTA